MGNSPPHVSMQLAVQPGSPPHFWGPGQYRPLIISAFHDTATVGKYTIANFCVQQDQSLANLGKNRTHRVPTEQEVTKNLLEPQSGHLPQLNLPVYIATSRIWLES